MVHSRIASNAGFIELFTIVTAQRLAPASRPYGAHRASSLVPQHAA
jgi:hypothetical protein